MNFERIIGMKKIISILLASLLLLSLFSCGTKKENAFTFTSATIGDIKDVVKVEMGVKDYGEITLELYHDVAPKTVENFVTLVSEGFYDGLTFHRVVSGFMIQGGDPDGDGTGGSEKTITGEFALNGFENNLSHTRGVISMARSNDPNSASSQFFICHGDAQSLDGSYAAFGKVIDGMDTVDAIAAVNTVYNSYGSEKSVPAKDIFIDYIVLLEQYDRDGEDAAEREPLETKSEEELYADPVKVEMSVKGHGKITLELYPNLAPETVENFITLASDGFYDGLTFHRIVSGFMIQGGDPDGNGTGGSDKNIKGEFQINGHYNPLSHKRGVISMARSSAPDSASSQFFICHADAKSLDGQYAAFGKVIEGLETVDSIAAVEVEYNAYGSEKSVPTEDVIIEYVKVLSDAPSDTSTPDTTEEIKTEIK